MRRFLKFFTNGPLPTAAPTAATLTTPDMIIAAHFARTFLSDADDWKATGFDRLHKRGVYNFKELYLRNTKLGVQLEWKFKQVPVGDYDQKYVAKKGECTLTKFASVSYDVLGGVTSKLPLDLDAALFLFDQWEKIAAQVAKTKEAAAKALREMQENEAKWNLAESLLGMKRNEHGALVPIVEVTAEATPNPEHSCDCDLGELCQDCGAPAPKPAPVRKPRKRKEKAGETALVPIEA